MSVELILTRLDYESSYCAYIDELGAEERYPFPLDFEYGDFAALLQRLDELSKGVGIPVGFVPSTTFWLVEGRELVGVSNLRHYLNERIRHHGGHIGLGIRPTYRGRGLGNELMALTLQKARRRGIAPIHVHCYKSNTSSARVIARMEVCWNPRLRMMGLRRSSRDTVSPSPDKPVQRPGHDNV